MEQAGGGTGARVRRDGWTPARQKRFLRALDETGCVRDACARAQISTAAAYRMRQREPRFAEGWKRALAKAGPTIEQAAFERAVLGWEEPVLYKGEVVAMRRRYSDALLRTLLVTSRRAAATDREAMCAQAAELAEAVGGTFTPPPAPGEPDIRDVLMAKLDEMHARLTGASDVPAAEAGAAGARGDTDAVDDDDVAGLWASAGWARAGG